MRDRTAGAKTATNRDRQPHDSCRMFHCQWTPKFSATYLEIEEHFGGFNFGGGNAQLDLGTMEFDWSCG
jgi:hypothetical protein